MFAALKGSLAPRLVEDFPFAESLARVAQSPLRDILPQVSQSDVISLALGMPASEMFPASRFTEASIEVLKSRQSTQYGEPFPPLKQHIAKLMAERGVPCTEDQVFLTSGSQQGLSLITRLLVDPGDAVITEDTIYDGLQMVLQTHDVNIQTVPTNQETGMDLDAVEAVLENGQRPSFIYTIPEGHNPLGVSMSPENRRRLIALAHRWRVPIIEDDAYGFLYYEGSRPPTPMRALDSEWVFYLGSFSKILAPALRLGWVVVPAKLTDKVQMLTSKLSILKQAADFDTSSLIQRMVSTYLDSGELPGHINNLRHEYKQRRDAMLAALDRHFPHEIRWNRPASGLFLWLELPPAALNMYELLAQAIQTEKVAFLPGQAFAIGPPSHNWNANCMRLSFGNCTPEEIEEGVARLGRVVKTALAALRRQPSRPQGILKKLSTARAARRRGVRVNGSVA